MPAPARSYFAQEVELAESNLFFNKFSFPIFWMVSGRKCYIAIKCNSSSSHYKTFACLSYLVEEAASYIVAQIKMYPYPIFYVTQTQLYMS